MTVQSANATNPNLLQWEQVEIKGTSSTVTFIHLKHSKGKPLTLTIRYQFIAGLSSSDQEGILVRTGGYRKYLVFILSWRAGHMRRVQ